MHAGAHSYVARIADRLELAGDVLELGARYVNGDVRDVILGDWFGVDLTDGPNVDLVADAATLDLDRRFDVVVCCEVLEHTPHGREIVAAAYRHLRTGGVLVATMAGPGRLPHSAIDGNGLRDGEHYANVTPADLHGWLQAAGFAVWQIDQDRDDVRCWARR